MSDTHLDTVELQRLGANPSVASFDKAVAGFGAFVVSADDSESYRVPLTEMLQSEGDVEGDLLATHEHLKKLKFNYTELYTKKRFLECVASGDVEESAELSAELDLQIAGAKRNSKAAKARLEKAQAEILEHSAPMAAQSWANLDARRVRYTNELEWLKQQDKENLAAGRAAQPKSKERSQAALDQLELEAHRVSNAIAKATETKQLLAEQIAPLLEREERAQASVAALRAEASNSGLADGYAKDEMVQWYSAASQAFAGLCGVEVLPPGDYALPAGQRDRTLILRVRSAYTVRACGGAGGGRGTPDEDTMADATGDSALRTGTHQLAVTFGEAVGSSDGAASVGRICALDLSPADVPTADLFQHAIAQNNLRFLVRELRARVGAYYARREEIGG
jgi:hypothetical protein